MGWLSRFFPRTLLETHTAFNKDIEVIETGNRRILRVNGIEQSGPYVETLFRTGFRQLPSWHPEDIQKILVIGVGGGVAITQLHALYPEAQITGVDLDPEIIGIARKYFGIQNCEFTVADARDYVEAHEAGRKLFDLIVIDIYIGNDVPAFVTQQKFLKQLQKLLRPDGGVIINYYHAYHQRRNVDSIVKRLSRMYRSVISRSIVRNEFIYFR